MAIWAKGRKNGRMHYINNQLRHAIHPSTLFYIYLHLELKKATPHVGKWLFVYSFSMWNEVVAAPMLEPFCPLLHSLNFDHRQIQKFQFYRQAL